MAGGCLVLGPLADSIGRRTMALASLTLLTASMAFSALAPDMTQLMVWRFITGDGVGARVAYPYPRWGDSSNDRRRPIQRDLMVFTFRFGRAVRGVYDTELTPVSVWALP